MSISETDLEKYNVKWGFGCFMDRKRGLELIANTVIPTINSIDETPSPEEMRKYCGFSENSNYQS